MFPGISGGSPVILLSAMPCGGCPVILPVGISDDCLVMLLAAINDGVAWSAEAVVVTDVEVVVSDKHPATQRQAARMRANTRSTILLFFIKLSS